MFYTRSCRILLAVAALALVSQRASAQIESGDKAISLSGLLSFTGGQGGAPSTTTGFAYGSVQYFMTRQIALRANVSEFITGGAGTSSQTGLGAGIEYDLQVSQNTTVPYFAFDVATNVGSSGGSSSVLLSPSAGLRFFMSRNTAFDVAGVYQTSASSSGSGTFLMQFGLSVFFGGDKRK